MKEREGKSLSTVTKMLTGDNIGRSMVNNHLTQFAHVYFAGYFKNSDLRPGHIRVYILFAVYIIPNLDCYSYVFYGLYGHLWDTFKITQCIAN